MAGRTERRIKRSSEFDIYCSNKYITDASNTNIDLLTLKEEIIPTSDYKLNRDYIYISSKKEEELNLCELYRQIHTQEYVLLKTYDFYETNNGGKAEIETKKELLKREFIDGKKACEGNLHIIEPKYLYFNLQFALLLIEFGGVSITEFWGFGENNPTAGELDYVEAFRQLAIGLSDIHTKSIYHGDICPQNIFFRDNIYKFASFGISHSIQEEFNSYGISGFPICRNNQFGGILGKLNLLYLPPEVQIYRLDNEGGEEDINWGKVDIYSLAFTIYSMIIKRDPEEEGKLKENSCTYPEFLKMVETNLENLVTIPNKQKLMDAILMCLSYHPQYRCLPMEIADILQ